MNTFAALDMLVRTADAGSFSAAARQLGVTPAAVSKQLMALEHELGVQLVVRSTRRLHLTEAGARLVEDAGPALHQVQAALASAHPRQGAVSGTLRVSLAPAFGRRYIVPGLRAFLAAHPGLRLDWQFDNRPVDLIAEGFDAGIAGGVDLAGGLVARPLVPLHLVAVASPAYLAQCGGPPPRTPGELTRFDALVLRSPRTGRARPWTLQRRNGRRETVEPRARCWLSDPEAVCDAALAGCGVGLVALTHAHDALSAGALVRLLPQWWSDAGAISVYYPPSRVLPAKTRAFVDHLVASLAADDLKSRVTAG